MLSHFSDPPPILVIAGELSGDLHAAPVIAHIKRQLPQARFFGTGGGELAKQGVNLLATTNELAVMGFTDIPRALPTLLKLKRNILRRVQSEGVRLAILVDYPGFNLNLAAALKRLPRPPRILYYIAPQVWAWRPGRIRKIRRLVDHLAVILPFELDLFQSAGIAASFVGHPLMEELSEGQKAPSGRLEVASPPTLALLPGSRRQLIARHLPVMLDAAQLLRSSHPGLKAAVGLAPSISEAYIRPFIGNSPAEIVGDTRELLVRADAAIVSSGTATLEAAIIGTPQAVLYRTSPLNYAIARRLVRVPHVSLVNLTAGRELVREYLQHQAAPKNLAAHLAALLDDPTLRREILTGYDEVRRKLGGGGASGRVAEIAVDLLNRNGM